MKNAKLKIKNEGIKIPSAVKKIIKYDDYKFAIRYENYCIYIYVNLTTTNLWKIQFADLSSPTNYLQEWDFHKIPLEHINKVIRFQKSFETWLFNIPEAEWNQFNGKEEDIWK